MLIHPGISLYRQLKHRLYLKIEVIQAAKGLSSVLDAIGGQDLAFSGDPNNGIKAFVRRK